MESRSKNSQNIDLDTNPEKPAPSMNIGATNLSNLSSEDFENSLLEEKFFSILCKIKKMCDGLFDVLGNFNYEKFWDGAERINIDEVFINLSEAGKEKLRAQEAIRRKDNLTTPDKAILVAIINEFRPQDQKVDRVIVSSRFAEIIDKISFQQFVNEVIALITDDEKLSDVLFPNLNYGEINAEKKNSIKICLQGIINERDNSQRSHQIRFLKKIVGETTKAKQKNR